MAATIVQVSVSRGGVPKTAVSGARVSVDGLEGDVHRFKHHGGPERAVCLFSMEAIVGLREEGHAIAPGAIGENVTVEGLDWSAVTPGARLLLGDTVLLQVTSYTSPCRTISQVFSDGQFSRVSQKHRPGWSRVYARVLLEGVIYPNDPVRLVDEIEAAEVTVAALR